MNEDELGISELINIARNNGKIEGDDRKPLSTYDLIKNPELNPLSLNEQLGIFGDMLCNGFELPEFRLPKFKLDLDMMLKDLSIDLTFCGKTTNYNLYDLFLRNRYKKNNDGMKSVIDYKLDEYGLDVGDSDSILNNVINDVDSLDNLQDIIPSINNCERENSLRNTVLFNIEKSVLTGIFTCYKNDITLVEDIRKVIDRVSGDKDKLLIIYVSLLDLLYKSQMEIEKLIKAVSYLLKIIENLVGEINIIYDRYEKILSRLNEVEIDIINMKLLIGILIKIIGSGKELLIIINQNNFFVNTTYINNFKIIMDCLIQLYSHKPIDLNRDIVFIDIMIIKKKFIEKKDFITYLC